MQLSSKKIKWASIINYSGIFKVTRFVNMPVIFASKIQKTLHPCFLVRLLQFLEIVIKISTIVFNVISKTRFYFQTEIVYV